MKKIMIPENMKSEWDHMPRPGFGIKLNDRLIYTQELTSEEVGQVYAAHGKKDYLFNKAFEFLAELQERGSFTSEDIKRVHQFKESLEGLEFEAQEAWGFSLDPKYHNWWLDLPGCSCPKMDNYDMIGSGRRITVETCVWHGGIV